MIIYVVYVTVPYQFFFLVNAALRIKTSLISVGFDKNLWLVFSDISLADGFA